MTGIRNYLRNLWLALTGNNPYQVELDEVREEYRKTASNVKKLEDFYYKALEKWDKADGQIKDYQTLVENLRKRVAEKDALIAEMDKDYRKRVAEKDALIAEMDMDYRKQSDGYKKRIVDYGEQIARLQGQLAKARKRTAKASKPKAGGKKTKHANERKGSQE